MTDRIRLQSFASWLSWPRPSPASRPLETASAEGQQAATVLTGREALGDWTTDAPGVRRKITIDDLAETVRHAVGQQFPQARPAARWGDASRAQGLSGVRIRHRPHNPRKIVTAPNGDIFVAESMPVSRPIKLLRDADGDGKAETH